MKEKYIPGEGCECSARCSCECGCDVDWTPREVYELRKQREEARDEIKKLKREVINWKTAHDIAIEQCDSLLEEREQWRMSSVCRELVEQRDRLAEVAQAVWDRWETPLWKDHPPTALVMNKLRDALAVVKG
jgi:septal ring factor EnvC (AmiA/AmiB activator)